MKSGFRLLTVTLCVVLVATLAHAQETNFRVLLTVSAPTGVKEEAESYLRRELRALRDVDLVETNSGYILRVGILETRSQSGIKTGYALSTSEASKPSINTLVDILKHAHQLTGEGGDLLRTASQDLEIFRTQNLHVGADLKRLCERVVAEFDSDLLEESRKFTRQFIETLKRVRGKSLNQDRTESLFYQEFLRPSGRAVSEKPANEIPFYMKFQPTEPKKPQ